MRARARTHEGGCCVVDCEKWLKVFLNENFGYADVNEVRCAAKKQGYSTVEVKAARKSLGVTTYHRFIRGWDTNEHYWCLPGKEPDLD